MSTKSETLDDSASWAVPTEDDIRRWESLPRDEQMRRLRKLFDSTECNTLSQRSVAEIFAAARARASSRSDG